VGLKKILAGFTADKDYNTNLIYIPVFKLAIQKITPKPGQASSPQASQPAKG